MNYRAAILPVVLLSVAACSAADVNKLGPDVTDLTASESRSAQSAASITLSPETTTIAVGELIKLNAVLRDNHGDLISKALGTSGVWSSSDSTVASVSTVSGTIEGKKDGVATISLSTGKTSGTATVTVGTGAVQQTSTAGTSTDAAKTPVATQPATTTTTTATTPAPTTTTPAPTAPVSQTPAPAPTTTTTNANGSGLSGKGFVYDDFTRYSDTPSLLNAFDPATRGGTAAPGTALYNDGWIGNLVQLDRSVLYNGHPTMKYNQPGGTAASPEVYVYFPNGRTLRKMWFRAKIKFSKGWTTTGTLTNSANSYKELSWAWQGTDRRGGLEITNTNEYQIMWSAGGSAGATSTGEFAGAGRAVEEWNGDYWYNYIIQWEQTSATTAVAKVWIARDGEVPVLRATSAGGSVGGAALPVVNRVGLGENFNQVRAATQNQAVWYGQWEVVDGEQNSNPFGVSGF